MNVPSLSRRRFLVAFGVAPFIAGCADSKARTSEVRSFTVDHDGTPVRCLFHDRQLAGDRPGCLAIVLLHGAGATADQWFDIGLAARMDELDLPAGVHRVVAVAPDIDDHDTASNLVISAVLPAIDPRFAPGMRSISGISRGAVGALDVASELGDVLVSVGLHSPAIRLTGPIAAFPARCWLEVGESDALDEAATATAAALTASGIDVVSHVWPGGHDRTYWRRHLADYLAFHVDSAAHRSTS